MKPPRLLWIIFAVALILRVIHLGRGFTADELTTWQATRTPLTAMIAERATQGHLPFYFAAMRPWAAIMPQADWALRLTSVAASLAALWCVWVIARRLLGERTALLACAIFAVNAAAIWVAQTFRAYAFLSLFLIMCHLFFWRYVEWRKPALLVAFFVCGLAGLLFQAVFGFYLLGFALVLLTFPQSVLPRRGALLATLLAAFACAAPFYLWLDHHVVIQPDRLERFPFRWLAGIQALATPFFGDAQVAHFDWPTGVAWDQILDQAIALLIIGAVSWQLMRRKPPVAATPLARAEFAGLVIVLLVAVLVPFVHIWHGQKHALSMRYFSPLAPFACLVMAATLGAIMGQKMRRAATAAAGVMLLLMTFLQLDYSGEGLEQSFKWLAQQHKPGEPILAVHGDHLKKGVAFYGNGDLQAALVPVDRQETSTQTLQAILNQHAVPGKRFWVVQFHERNSKLSELAGAPDFAVEKRDKNLKRVALQYFERPSPGAQTSENH